MGELERGERLQIMLTLGEIEALDNWRFAHRMPSRAASVRELLKGAWPVKASCLLSKANPLAHSACLGPN